MTPEDLEDLTHKSGKLTSHHYAMIQGIGKDVPRSQRTLMGNPYIYILYIYIIIKPYNLWVFMGFFIPKNP